MAFLPGEIYVASGADGGEYLLAGDATVWRQFAKNRKDTSLMSHFYVTINDNEPSLFHKASD